MESSIHIHIHNDPDNKPKKSGVWIIVLTAFILPFLLYTAKSEYDQVVIKKQIESKQDTLATKSQSLKADSGKVPHQ